MVAKVSSLEFVSIYFSEKYNDEKDTFIFSDVLVAGM